MYNTIESAFTDALSYEGKLIYSYADNTSYTVLFRKNDDKNNLTNKLSIFYPTNFGIKDGQLLKYDTKYFLAINQQTPENDVFNSSDLFECNATMNYITTDGIEHNIPIYSYDVQSALTVSGNVISMVGGNIEILAEDSIITRTLKIDDTFYALGGYWKIDNLIYKDNVIYIYVERTANSITYTVDITANDYNVHIGLDTKSQN